MGRAQGRLAQAAAVSSGRGPRGPYKWNDEHIEAGLRLFLADRPDWPTAEEFRAAGQYQLLDAMLKTGGVNRWAPRLSRALRPRQDRSEYPLEQAPVQARALIAEHGRLPSQKNLTRLGHPRLAWLVEKAGGAKAFARTHGL